MRHHAEVGKVEGIAVGVVAVPAHGGEGVCLAGGSDGQGNGIGTAEEVLQATVIVVGETTGHVAIEEGVAGAEHDLVRLVGVMALALHALATREGGVLVNGIVVTRLATTNATVVHAVPVAVLQVRAIRFVTPTVDVVQVDRHEEALHFVGGD